MDDARYNDLREDMREQGRKIDGVADICSRTAANVDRLGDYIKAVSENTKENRVELQGHKEDLDAHGRKAESRSSKAMLAWLGIGLALFEAAMHIGTELLKARPH